MSVYTSMPSARIPNTRLYRVLLLYYGTCLVASQPTSQYILHMYTYVLYLAFARSDFAVRQDSKEPRPLPSPALSDFFFVFDRRRSGTGPFHQGLSGVPSVLALLPPTPLRVSHSSCSVFFPWQSLAFLCMYMVRARYVSCPVQPDV